MTIISAQANELLRMVSASHSSPKLEALYDFQCCMRAAISALGKTSVCILKRLLLIRLQRT